VSDSVATWIFCVSVTGGFLLDPVASANAEKLENIISETLVQKKD
jgi:hypothetical protein